MNEQKINLKGFKNLVTVDDFKNEISMVTILIRDASGARKMQLNRYRHKLQINLNTFWKFREQSL